MKRSLALIFALALLGSLFGCAQHSDGTEGSKRISTATAVFTDQACRLAHTLALTAEPGYLQAMEAPAEIIPDADIFSEAATKEPEQILLTTTGDTDLPAQITEICSTRSGANAVALCSLLTLQTQFHLQSLPADTTAVYLRYSDACHMIAIFSPAGTHTVNVTVYPLFSEVAEAVLSEYFSGVQALSEAEIQRYRETAESVDITAEYSGSTVNKLYYYKLASRALTGTDPINAERIGEYTDDAAIAAMVGQFGQAMTAQPSEVAVFRFPADVWYQAEDVLAQAQSPDALADTVRRRIYLGWINQLSGEFGMECTVANAILNVLDSSRPLGSVADKTAEPMLAVLQLGGEVTVVMSIYPGEHNQYDYRYVCLPVTYEVACNILRSNGANQIY